MYHCVQRVEVSSWWQWYIPEYVKIIFDSASGEKKKDQSDCNILVYNPLVGKYTL